MTSVEFSLSCFSLVKNLEEGFLFLMKVLELYESQPIKTVASPITEARNRVHFNTGITTKSLLGRVKDKNYLMKSRIFSFQFVCWPIVPFNMLNDSEHTPCATSETMESSLIETLFVPQDSVRCIDSDKVEVRNLNDKMTIILYIIIINSTYYVKHSMCLKKISFKDNSEYKIKFKIWIFLIYL